METSAHLQSDDLREYGIESVTVELEVERMPRESYHRAGSITEIEEVVPLDGCLNPREKLEELALQKGCDNAFIYLFEEFTHELNEVAVEEGPLLEAAQYSAYMADKAESDYH